MSARRRRALWKRFYALRPSPPDSRWRGYKRSYVRKEEFLYVPESKR